jgi:integrase
VDLRNAVATIPSIRAKAKKDRYIHLNAVAMSILRELPAPIDRQAFVFANSAGGKEINIERHWRQAISAAGVEDFRFHDLRHTYASRLVMAGVDLAVLRELLGHSDFTMTLRYAHLSPSRLKSAVTILESQDLQFTCNHGDDAQANAGERSS